MIEKTTLVEMFKAIKENGLPTNEELLWGYFFADNDPEKLQSLVPALENRGFRFVDLFEAEPEDEDSITAKYYLHVEKIEHHDIDTLDARNKELGALSEQYGVDSYDGMDVGPIEGGLEGPVEGAMFESNN